MCSQRTPDLIQASVRLPRRKEIEPGRSKPGQRAIISCSRWPDLPSTEASQALARPAYKLLDDCLQSILAANDDVLLAGQQKL
jgi:hypothetical protein